ncbi:MAG: hypothetical protein JW807_00765 [Spirochaetes bacterium]|nr:hypothetical protein [Spirochaetota bacterium]
MLYDVLWNLVIVIVVFVLYASLGIAVSGFLAFRAVNKKRQSEVRHVREDLEKAS